MRDPAFKSRADDDFMSHFMGQPSTSQADSVTEGPMAGSVRDPVAFRRHQASQQAREPPTSSGMASKHGDAGGARVDFAAPPPPKGKRFFTSPSPAPDGYDVNVKMAGEEDEPPSPSSLVNVLPAGMTAPVTGSDVGQLPGPSTAPMKMTTAPEAGKKAPAPTAEQVTKSLLKALQSRGRRGRVPGAQVPRNESSTTPKSKNKNDGAKKDEAPNRDRVTFYADNDAGDPGARGKVAVVLKAIGVVPSLVREHSVLWHAVTDKIASTQPRDDAEVYVTRDDVHPVALWTFMGSRYGDEWLGWDAETIKTTMIEDLGREPTAVVMNKIAALKLVTASPLKFFDDWHVFEKVCLALDGQPPRLTLVEDLSPEQMAFGVSVMRMIDPGQNKFAGDLSRYCAARLHDAGFVVAPPELGFADADLAKLAHGHGELRKHAFDMYLAALKGEEPRDRGPESPEIVQAGRLLRVHAYVLDKVEDLICQAS